MRRKLSKVRLVSLDLSTLPTRIMSAVKVRGKMIRDGFTANSKTEKLPAINTDRTERMPIFDERDMIERTLDALRELK
jgi:hypothetical protein